MHTPVFRDEVIEALAVKKDGRYIDGTLGEGGHTHEIIKRGGRVLGIDLDPKQIALLDFQFPRLQFQKAVGNYKDIEKIAKEYGFYPVDGVLLDLGLSMRQLQESGKGLSYKNKKEFLDMRISGEGTTAEEILNQYTEEELYEMLSKYSEDIHAKELAQEIVKKRSQKSIQTVEDLNDIVGSENRLSQIYQALRIEVNHEYNNILAGLRGALNIVKEGGRIVVITFHSLEDRWVKRFAKENRLELIKVKINQNTRMKFERSAYLRIMKK